MNGNEIMYREKNMIIIHRKKNLSHNSTVMGGGVTRWNGAPDRHQTLAH